MQLYLYMDDMGVLAQGTTHIIETQFYASIADLDAVLCSVDARLSRGEPGATGGTSVVLAPSDLLAILAAQFLALGIAVIDHEFGHRFLFKALRAFRRLFLKPAGPGKCYLGGLRGQKGDQKDLRGALLGILGRPRVPLGGSLAGLVGGRLMVDWGRRRRLSLETLGTPRWTLIL